MNLKTKEDFRKRRQMRLRKKIIGTSERPRMSVFRSNKQLYVQFIDDVNQVTVASASSMQPDLKAGKGRVKVEEAVGVGKAAAEAVKSKGIDTVVFDRGGNRYSGKIRALANGLGKPD